MRNISYSYNLKKFKFENAESQEVDETLEDREEEAAGGGPASPPAITAALAAGAGAVVWKNRARIDAGCRRVQDGDPTGRSPPEPEWPPASTVVPASAAGAAVSEPDPEPIAGASDGAAAEDEDGSKPFRREVPEQSSAPGLFREPHAALHATDVAARREYY